jgi:CRISPR-associated protein Cas1
VKYESRNLRELPKFRDGLSYLYIEHARIEQQDRAIACYGPEGMIAVPVAALGVLFLGPGTAITHAAIRNLAEGGCMISWVGEGFGRFHATGLGETRSGLNLQRQARAWADPRLHLEVVMRLYRIRFGTPLPDGLTLRQIRGMEGIRVREAYAQASRETGVQWRGRNYKRGHWHATDPVNRAISAGASILYGVCHSAIVSAGYSPALGFIHTGKQLSFVYDLADVYKTEILVPVSFRIAAESAVGVEPRVRAAIRIQIQISRLLERVVSDLHSLFSGLDQEEGHPEEGDVYSDDAARPGNLWDPGGAVPGGVDYGGDGSGEGPTEPERGTDTLDG